MSEWTKEQTLAIHKNNTNILVNAGAGSGKTAVLTTRVMEKLKTGIHIDELLILTFTNKAASEMKERIRKRLKEEPSLKEELSRIDVCHIETFDAYALSIVKKYHYLLNLPPMIEISSEPLIELLRKDVMRFVLDQLYEEKNADFLTLIDRYCVKDDDNLYTYLLAMSKKIELDLQKEKRLLHYEEYFLKEENIVKWINEFTDICKQKQQAIKKSLEELKRIAPLDYVSKCMQRLSGLLTSNTLDEMCSFHSSKLPPVPRNSEEEIKLAKEMVSQPLKELKALLEYGAEEELRTDIQNSKSVISILCHILNRYFIEFETKKREKDYFDFGDVAKYALTIFKTFPSIAEEIKNSLEEIMIDEYQDTNDIQEEFISYISKDNLFMVGDLKQSIYRFRNANPYLFQKKYDMFRQKKGGENIDLLHNFRSREEVLGDINRVFNNLMTYDFGGADYLQNHQMKFGNKMYEAKNPSENYQMEIITYEEKQTDFTKEEIEAFYIAKDIKRKIEDQYQVLDNGVLRPAKYDDFAILMDRSTNFDLYKKVFEYFHLPLSIQKDEGINDTMIFSTIKNLLKLTISYQEKNFDDAFRHALVSILRGFLVSYSDEKIYDIIKQRDWYQNPIYERLEPLILKSPTLTLPTFLNELYKRTKIYDNLIKIGNIEESITILKYMKNLSKECGNHGYQKKDFYSFLSRIQKEEMPVMYSVDEDASNSIKLLTIHKSKGLEYPICYLSGLYKKFNLSETSDLFQYDKKYGFLVPLKKEGIYKSFWYELAKQNTLKEELSEKIRLLYVAMTRSKEKMIFVMPKTKKEYDINSNEQRLKCRSFCDFFSLLETNLKPFKKPLEIESLNLTKDYLFTVSTEEKEIAKVPRLKVEEIYIESVEEQTAHFSKRNFSLYSKEDYKNVNMGLKVHEYFECIDFKNPNYDLIPEPFLRKKVKKLIENPIIQKNLEGTFQKEYEFIDQSEKEYHGIIDLLIETDEKILIIDYKLDNIIDEAYQKQLEGYRTFILKKTKKPVELFLYSILQEELVSLPTFHIGIG